jgi:sulfur-carrier protein adenylyltransferase/sulfurtransferase
MPRRPLVSPGPDLTVAERTRYARHLLLPDLGGDGQRRLRAARVLIVGAGGLGSPAALYLAAAGVGTLGIVDDDVVDLTNLQRQILHGDADVGRPKTDSAAEALGRLAPLTTVQRHPLRLDAATALEVAGGYDLVLDGADNFPTRYVLGDACTRLRIPHVWGSVYRFDGQVSVWWAGQGPCYRCVFPAQPEPDAVPSCSVGGVLGSVCASVGAVMATEAIKLITGVGEPLVGRVLLHDALRQTWDTIAVRTDQGCGGCGSAAGRDRPLGWTSAPPAEHGPVRDPAPARHPSITAFDLGERLAGHHAWSDATGSDALVLDVREAGEREVVVIPGSVWLPLARIRAGTADDPLPGLTEAVPGRVFVYCKSGARSAEAVGLLRSRGVDAVDVVGGVLAWVRDVDPSLPSY